MEPETTSYLAFDLGASSCRAVVGMLRSGKMDLEEIHRFPTPVKSSGSQLRWDIEAMWVEMTAALENAISHAPNLRSLSVDSWGVDYVLLDERGKPVGLPYCYRDSRAAGIMEHVISEIGADTLFATTGTQFLPFNTIYQLIADRRAGLKGSLALSIADYFNHRFGGSPVLDASMASTTQLMHATGPRRLASNVMDRLGLDATMWPRIVPSGTRLGPCQQHPEIDIVASCSHDTGAAVAAIPSSAASGTWAFISCGTWSLLGAELDAPNLSAEARLAGFTNEVGIDDSIRFLKNLTGLWVLQECMRDWGASVTWQQLEHEARLAVPSKAVIDLEDSLFLAPGNMQSRLESKCQSSGVRPPETRGAWVRFILQSIADSYRRARADLVRVTGQSVDTLHMVGGGSQNALLCQLAADACGTTVVAGPAEATAFGNLLIQARTMGHLPPDRTIRDVAAQSCTLKTYEPAHEGRAHDVD